MKKRYLPPQRQKTLQRRWEVGQHIDAVMARYIDHYKNRLISETDLNALLQLPADERRRTVARWVVQFMSEERVVFSRVEQELLIQQIIHETVGYGPLETYLNDPDVTEVLVNGKDEIFIERHGKLEQVPLAFRDDGYLRHLIDRIVSPVGRRIDESSPMVDARLPDGSRVNAVIPPVSLRGPLLSIRKFRKEPYSMDDLRRFGSFDEQIQWFLAAAVNVRTNILISGGTGSGKTTLLNAMAQHIPHSERVITIEDSAELKIYRPNVVGLEARPANVEGKGEIPIRQLVRNALRMRPDRIIVGEVRGAEAFDMLQAMNTGHEGSLTTVHANSPRDALNRVEGMVMMAGLDLNPAIIREYIASAVDLIMQVERLRDGQRKVVAVAELFVDPETQKFTVKPIYVYKRLGIDEEGRVVGYHTATGYRPAAILEKFQIYGLRPPEDLLIPREAPDVSAQGLLDADRERETTL
ncbi:MAG: Type II/IV secretion system ATP hydrolase TadA/VirB11/CpaF, TadA subfamily [Candidatus Carbobacillus altaicus]|uniref:Type II/IV secretion system ATP hydrolase TadA/VirB11/CpaF, TadA subfamily n=1 Tax=Candidatus Carbonibacillus altaicus TaxID=2163959 RepID=A0A2R6Y542_9BACL|nr:MAG: Type II/IV secretion system ATP hydrolase TadA/VirB11/CpaF, TadA subfamily [Candidatus Carbobacillus altaicus]